LAATQVDPLKGLYLVSRTVRGTQTPIHVRISSLQGKQKIDCENHDCLLAYAAASKQNFEGFLCKHAAAAMASVRHQSNETELQEELNQAILRKLVADRLITKESATAMLKRKEVAAESGVPTAIFWWPSPATSNHLFISLHESHTASYARNNRVVVTYNRKNMHISCPCSAEKKAKKKRGLHCIHAKVDTSDLLVF
jgi:hypothetical protein